MVSTELPALSQLTLRGFSTSTPPAELEAFIDLIRPVLERVIAVFQGKGGQGKTSIATHTAGLLAEAEAAKAEDGQPHGRVLLIEMDLQGNAHEDLGTGTDPLNDEGYALREAILGGHDPIIIRDVRGRQCLDLLPAGEELSNLPAGIMYASQQRGPAAWLGLAVLIARLVVQYGYSWVVIDCPPSSKEPQILALAAARYALVPMSVADAGSIKGMEGVSKRFTEARKYNPDLMLLGAVLFKFAHKYYTDKKTGEKRAVGAWVEARREVEEILAKAGVDAPVFRSVIRDAETVAKACRGRGQLSFEIAEATDGVKWWEKRRGSRGNVLPTERAEQVGEDYLDLVEEIVSAIAEIEAEDAAESGEVLPA
ncbi:ParA family protein [Amycolatopsis sp. cg9]|uniref:ParA family protein n=1 Tax=Amycolatopsis sp. cg9 TaxID=3238801 RepID=UPI003523A0B7